MNINLWVLFTSVALYPYYTVRRIGRFVVNDSYLVAKF